MSTIDLKFVRALLAPIAVALVLLAGGCDSATIPSEVVVQGAVTTHASAEEHTGQEVQDATVTPHEVRDDGSERPMEGQATTNANGQYSLTTESTSSPVIVRADWAGNRAAVLLEAGAATTATVNAPPMTAESTAEADVFLQARTQTPAFTVAAASAYVSGQTAAMIVANRVTTAQVATSAAASFAAESALALEHASATQVANAHQERRRAYAQYRSQLRVATTTAARLAAVETFLEAYARGYSTAGVHMTRQAQASIAGAGAGVRFAAGADVAAIFSASHRARVMAALAMALAIEQEFQATGASSGRVNAITQARGTFVAAVRAATTAQAVATALAEFRTAVRAELAAEANVSPGAIDSAFAATATARTALNAAVAGAASASVVASAYATFFTAARQAAQADLGIGATFAAEVIALIAAY